MIFLALVVWVVFSVLFMPVAVDYADGLAVARNKGKPVTTIQKFCNRWIGLVTGPLWAAVPLFVIGFFVESGFKKNKGAFGIPAPTLGKAYFATVAALSIIGLAVRQ